MSREDVRAHRRLIRFYTRRRDWTTVRALLLGLGELWERS